MVQDPNGKMIVFFLGTENYGMGLNCITSFGSNFFIFSSLPFFTKNPAFAGFFVAYTLSLPTPIQNEPQFCGAAVVLPLAA